MITWLVTNKSEGLRVGENVKVIRQIESGNRKLTCVGNWSHKLSDLDYLEKQNQTYRIVDRKYSDFENLDKVTLIR